MKNRNNIDEFPELSNFLADLEPADKASKDRIYHRLTFKMRSGTIQPNIMKRNEIVMKKNTWKTVIISAMAVAILTGTFSTTSFAKNMLVNILARFQVGNMQIVQYDKESALDKSSSEQAARDASRKVQLQERPNLTVEEARAILELNFPAPSWLADYKYVNTVIHGDNMAEVQFNKGEETVNFLISKGGENGIGTTGEVKKEVIKGTPVYFANGIVVWENNGFTVELYAQADFDTATLGKIIESFKVGAPLKKEEIEKAKEKMQNTPPTEGAGPAPASN
ncbi:hypothetical protein V4V36_21955 [Paenibacillus lautus]|uniref:hypothetical protein n=1 Tax=Paenibacillus lautus TaxID=1401 RepID=UPI001ABF4AF5|nr:hypothetical protein [Paenibacillus lautus]MBY0160652.1 hypothetical protein [Cytobacillus firmus]MCI1776948.1 hypothetical protein [Paenibacillus lautus]